MRLFEAMAATWPTSEVRRLGSWTLRRGAGAGNRVSAATLDGPADDIDAAEAAMRAWGQRPIFMIRPGDEAFANALCARGYEVRDPTLVMVAPPGRMAPATPDERAVHCAAPLAAMREIWADGGVGPGRLAVMARARPPKSYLLGRTRDAPAACAFAALDREVAMLHALEVAPAARRQGLGAALTRAAAAWAVEQGAETLALDVAAANAPARALYSGLGMTEAAAYHYRLAPEGFAE